MTNKSKVLVTGAAGFIGFHLAQRLLKDGYEVLGIDNLNDYYDPNLKLARLEQLQQPGFTFVKLDLADRGGMQTLFASHRFDYVVHLAAQAGVRYSIDNPQAYIDSNLVGFGNILEGVRNHPVKHLIYASSSSVYGANRKMPLATGDAVNHPMSLYAATKKANELMAHTYSSLYAIPTTGLRFFTVYGPWGRPDMALFKFTKGILEGNPIDIYNGGEMWRDFTYVDDIVESMVRLLDKAPAGDSNWNPEAPNANTSYAPYRVFNIGNSQPVLLNHMIAELEKAIGRSAIKNFMPIQPGDVVETHADVADLEKITEFKPRTVLSTGIKHFVDWYQDYYQCNLADSMAMSA